MKKNILILGLNSYIGTHLGTYLSDTFSTTGISRAIIPHPENMQLLIGDSVDESFLHKTIVDLKIDMVINCICLGNVDQCEKDQDLAYKVNFAHVENITKLSKNLGFKLIHFSSNAVYDGDHPLYSETSIHEPKNYYGKVKAMADEHIKSTLNDYLIIRVMTLYGGKEAFHRHNPATMIINALNENKPLKLVNDIYNNLLFIDDLLEFIKIALMNNLSGEYNVSGNEVVNRYEFGLLICQAMNKPASLVTACSSDDFPSLANRAYNTSFDNTKVKELTGVKLSPLSVGIEKTISKQLKG